MTIKKAYLGIIDLLEANSSATVDKILPQVIELASTKQAGGTITSVKDKAGNVTHVFCYYHKLCEPVAEVEFGAKASSSTGLNNMCKEGTSNWSKQQRSAKTANANLLTQVATNKLAPKDIEAAQAKIEATRKQITPRNDKIGVKDMPMT